MPHHDIGRGYSDKIVSEATYDEPKDDSVSENGAGNIQKQRYHVFPFKLKKSTLPLRYLMHLETISSILALTNGIKIPKTTHEPTRHTQQ